MITKIRSKVWHRHALYTEDLDGRHFFFLLGIFLLKHKDFLQYIYRNIEELKLSAPNDWLRIFKAIVHQMNPSVKKTS